MLFLVRQEAEQGGLVETKCIVLLDHHSRANCCGVAKGKRVNRSNTVDNHFHFSRIHCEGNLVVRVNYQSGMLP